MQVEITLTQAGAAAIARLSAFPARMLPAVARGLDRGLELALGQATAKRFTGKGPFAVSEKRLGVVSGRLRASLRRSAARVEGDSVRAAVGTNVRYFGIHEFGFNGTVNVKAHKRVRFVGANGKAVAARRVKKGMEVTGYEGTVQAHSRRVNVIAREPMRAGLTEQAGLIGRAISGVLVSEWSGGAA